MSWSSRFLRASAVVIVLALAGSASATAGPIYTVDFDGSSVDLSGVIEIGVTGAFSPGAFNAVVTDYAITASATGGSSFTFTAANSTWGGLGGGGNVTVNVTASEILLSSSAANILDFGNLFLLSDVATGGGCCLPNLKISSDGVFAFRPPDDLVGLNAFELISTPFVLATDNSTVPEPATFTLLSVGGALLLQRRRRATLRQAKLE